MKIEDLKENYCVLISTKEEAEAMAKLLNKAGIVKPISKEKFKADWMDIGNWPYLHIENGKHADLYRNSKEWKVIPASKFLKPSLKKRVKELEKEVKEIRSQLNNTYVDAIEILAKPSSDIEVHFDEVEKLPEKWCVKLTEENHKIIGKWFNDNNTYDNSFYHKKHYIGEVICFPKNDRESYWLKNGDSSDYTEISFETFMRFVYKADEKPVELEAGKWYKLKEDPNCIACYKGEHSAYGIKGNGIWSTDIKMSQIDYWQPATDEEVKTALIAEAERRGFKEGVKIYRENGFGLFIPNTVKLPKIDIGFRYFKESQTFEYNGISIFYKGKWAEIIPEPEIDFSKAGQLVKSNDGTVLLYTTDEPPKDVHHFSGAVVKSDLHQKGHTCNHWLIKMFTLCTEPVTLQN